MNEQQRAVVQQALEALTIQSDRVTEIGKKREAITALRQLLEQPEPVFCEYCGGNDDADFGLPTDHCTDCARPQPEQPADWVGLTADEMLEALIAIDPATKRLPIGFARFAQAIEAKLKEKNT